LVNCLQPQRHAFKMNLKAGMAAEAKRDEKEILSKRI
jgi:hypothetical protein